MNDNAVASHVVSINAAISGEASTARSAEAIISGNLSSELVARASSVSSLETNLSTLISAEASSLSSLETRENNRHNKIAFSNVASLEVDGSSFPTGFDPSTGGFIQLFETDGSNLVSFIAPMEIDSSTGNVTFTFEGNKSGIAVFYCFADDEGTVTV